MTKISQLLGKFEPSEYTISKTTTGILVKYDTDGNIEYKNVFGNRSDVKVFGSNPYYTELLRLNPFVFPFG